MSGDIDLGDGWWEHAEPKNDGDVGFDGSLEDLAEPLCYYCDESAKDGDPLVPFGDYDGIAHADCFAEMDGAENHGEDPLDVENVMWDLRRGGA